MWLVVPQLQGLRWQRQEFVSADYGDLAVDAGEETTLEASGRDGSDAGEDATAAAMGVDVAVADGVG
jgi:hypothetical protein